MTTEAPPWTPACMDPPEWADWQRLNPTLRQTDHAERPCEDCPAGYARQMRAIGRCNGEPGGEPMEGNGVATLPRLAVTGRELKVTATLPCERCAHAVVCRIRPALEARLESVPVELPHMDPAITVTLSAEVECAQFLRATGSKAPAKHGGGPRPGYVRSPEHTAKIAAANRARGEAKRNGYVAPADLV